MNIPAQLREIYISEFAPELIHHLNHHITILQSTGYLLRSPQAETVANLAGDLAQISENLERCAWLLSVLHEAAGGRGNVRAMDNALTAFFELLSQIYTKHSKRFRYQCTGREPAGIVSLVLSAALRAATGDNACEARYEAGPAGAATGMLFSPAWASADPALFAHLESQFGIQVRRAADGSVGLEVPLPPAQTRR